MMIDLLLIAQCTIFLISNYLIAKILGVLLVIPTILGVSIFENFALANLYLPFKKGSLDKGSLMIFYSIAICFILYNIFCIYIFFYFSLANK